MTDRHESIPPVRRGRRIALVAAYAGGGLTAVAALGGATLAGLILGETKLARRRIPIAVDRPPVSDGTSWAAGGVSPHRPPIRLAVLGDSSAAGYGVYRDRDTLAVQLAIGISTVARRPVHITNVAVVGAESQQLPAQVDALGRTRPDLAVIMIGANDVTHRIKPAAAVPHQAEAVRRLRACGAEVVLGTCPDLGTIRPLAQPLRRVARHLSRTMAKQQTIAVVAAGGRTVSLGDILGPLFATQREMFSDDQFHPSAAGYAAAADALLPSCLDALGIRTRARSASAFTTRLPKSVGRAAAQAAHHPGSEVAGAEPGMALGRRRRALTRGRMGFGRGRVGFGRGRVGFGRGRIGFGRGRAAFGRRDVLAQLRRRRTRPAVTTSPETAVTTSPPAAVISSP